MYISWRLLYNTITVDEYLFQLFMSNNCCSSTNNWALFQGSSDIHARLILVDCWLLYIYEQRHFESRLLVLL